MSDIQVFQADPKAAYDEQRDEIRAAIGRVLESGRYILGQEVAAFERAFADYIGCNYCLGVASGTDALIGALRMLDVKNGYVVTVSHTSVATVAAIECAGAKALLIDIDDSTFTLDPSELAQVLRHPPGRIAAIIVVHLYGHAADMNAIMPLARQYGVPVIEDCAQSHGARLGQKRLGSFGDIAAFSFYPTKNLGAVGDGGGIMLDDERCYEQLKAYRQYGWKKPQISEFVGVCSRLDELQAAILREKLRVLDRDNARRRQIAARYQDGLRDLPLRLPSTPADVTPVFHQYVVRSMHRDALRAALERRGVNTGIHYALPVHLQPAYLNRVALGPSGLSRTERAAHEILSLPMYPQLSDLQVAHVIATIRKVCRE